MTPPPLSVMVAAPVAGDGHPTRGAGPRCHPTCLSALSPPPRCARWSLRLLSPAPGLAVSFLTGPLWRALVGRRVARRDEIETVRSGQERAGTTLGHVGGTCCPVTARVGPDRLARSPGPLLCACALPLWSVDVLDMVGTLQTPPFLLRRWPARWGRWLVAAPFVAKASCPAGARGPPAAQDGGEGGPTHIRELPCDVTQAMAGPFSGLISCRARGPRRGAPPVW